LIYGVSWHALITFSSVVVTRLAEVQLTAKVFSVKAAWNR
jgi:hypothetical protein